MARIIVTGAAGFIGSYTTERLLAAGHEVVGLDNFRTGHRRNLDGALTRPAFGLIVGDVAEPGVIEKAVMKFQPHGIIHLAALVSVQESIRDPKLNQRLNYLATDLVAKAAAAHGVKRVVFASSAAVYGDSTDLPLAEESATQPISPYGEAKLASERLLLARGAAGGFVVRCHRYFNVFGPRQDPTSPYSGVISIFDRKYREGHPVVIFGDGQQTRDFISVHDVARANVVAATVPNITTGTANICTGHATSLLDVVQVFAAHYPRVGAPKFAPARAGDIVHSVGRPGRAKRELNFTAEISVADGLDELIRQG
ncbi:MAG: NAD-dependent epimerase/dehydratase family protein [Opitutales bacterium]